MALPIWQAVVDDLLERRVLHPLPSEFLEAELLSKWMDLPLKLELPSVGSAVSEPLLLDFVDGQCYLTGMSQLLFVEPTVKLDDPGPETLGECLLFTVHIGPLLKRNAFFQVLAAKRASVTSVFIDDPLMSQQTARE
jgi:hypothetical protein